LNLEQSFELLKITGAMKKPGSLVYFKNRKKETKSQQEERQLRNEDIFPHKNSL